MNFSRRFSKKASAFSFMETERLVLRCYAEQDRADFISLFTDKAGMKYVVDSVLNGIFQFIRLKK